MTFRMSSVFVLVALACSSLAQSGNFNILSFNVAGLPQFLEGNGESGDKTTNTMIIGQTMASNKYDLIHVQEDFNYHSTLYKYDTHPYRTTTSGGVPFGSGLNTLSNYNWIEFDRITWDDCSDASEWDCLTPKGFTFMRWAPAPGVYIDVYNVHTDAGTKDGDEKARASNLQQVADYVAANSVGNPVIIFGDTNTLYSRAADTIRDLVSEGGLTDAWVQLIKGGVPPTAGVGYPECPHNEIPADTTCETLDKVLYRGSPALSLTATAFAYDTTRFLGANSTTLSDHNPVRVEFTWSLTTNVVLSDLYGGTGGAWFNDLDLVQTPGVQSVTLRGASRLDAISFGLSDGRAAFHGGQGGSPYSLTLGADEYFTRATQCWGTYKDSLRNFYVQLVTSTGNAVAAGVMTSSCATTSAPSGWAIVGARGKSGSGVDQLGWIMTKLQ